MSRRGAQPRSIIVKHDGQDYERDLGICRRALLQRAIEGDFDNTAEFAVRVGLSLNTVYGWFAGTTPGKDETTRRILAGLRLEFDDVHARVGATAAEVRPVMTP